jgi:mannose-6-phosphate isomerase-like protein (cupin superfamily)
MIISEKISPGYERTIAYLDNLMVTICNFTNGPALSPDLPHSHPHEQITYVAEGKLKFFRGDEESELSKGDIVTVPSGVSHCIQILTDRVTLIDSFSPVREDFIKTEK